MEMPGYLKKQASPFHLSSSLLLLLFFFLLSFSAISCEGGALRARTLGDSSACQSVDRSVAATAKRAASLYSGMECCSEWLACVVLCVMSAVCRLQQCSKNILGKHTLTEDTTNISDSTELLACSSSVSALHLGV